MHFRKGFTLIELLVVISIIGLLSSIVFSSVATARYKANNAVTELAVRNYIQAIERYRIDNNKLPYPGAVPANSYFCLGSTTCSHYSANYTNSPTIDAALAPYAPSTNSNLPKFTYSFTMFSTTVSGEVSGIMYTCVISNGECGIVQLHYYLRGTRTCRTALGVVNGYDDLGNVMCVYSMNR